MLFLWSEKWTEYLDLKATLYRHQQPRRHCNKGRQPWTKDPSQEMPEELKTPYFTGVAFMLCHLGRSSYEYAGDLFIYVRYLHVR